MNYALRFRPEVVTDLEDVARWYDERSPGLGAEFLAESRTALDRIAREPEQTAADAECIRAHRLRRFPYVVYYRIDGAVIVVFAIMFGGRDPTVWQGRS
ncbi:MAG: toxin ParE1/3/4 [Pirellulaceae bacterium]|jgi:toxin ParE1/3/4